MGEVLAEKDRTLKEWNKKLQYQLGLEEAEEKDSKIMKRKLQKSSYEHGVLEGKLRSSDVYFRFLWEDTSILHEKETMLLKRSDAIMNAQMATLKNEVREQLKMAAEAQPSS